ncbi:MAG TPA: arginine N-succinyltransferase [Kofleriaceae bacterium]|nr:arginine N-succinyltransferase [Kofleriaceae bacterium]
MIRQSFRADADQILAVARHLDTVNLPADAGRIARILELSEQSFAGTVPVSEREYLFVLEDLDERRVIGTSMIHAQHGTRRAPHVYFAVGKDERYSESLDRYFVHRCLGIGYDYDGPTEIGGLILLPEYRGHTGGLGRLLSYTRFLFIAMHRTLFRDRVLSELLPPLEEDGTSILWEHLGRHFTGLSYQEADLISKDNKEFIKSLFPHSRIYTALLPRAVQQVIGQVGPATKGVEKMLRRIGFEYAEQIDPFDGGPHFVARTEEITLVAGARRLPAETGGEGGPQWAIVAHEPGGPPNFRAMAVKLSSPPTASVRLTAATLDVLGAQPGDPVWVVVS